MKYHIHDVVWKKIYKILCTVKAIHKEEGQLRLFIEGLYYTLRSGCQWRFLPEYYGDGRAVHKRFFEWKKKGIWDDFFEYMKKDPDMETFMLDGTIVRAHACAAGYVKNSNEQEALGRSCGGFSTKIHALVDALGNPIKFILTAGQIHDVTQAKSLCENVHDANICADKAYDSDEFIKCLKSNNCTPAIPSKQNRIIKRDYDKVTYKERYLIECFFGKIKHFRRIFSRFDKAASTYLAFSKITAGLIWLR